MIEALRHEDVILKVGGRFRLTALIQKRLIELLEGSRPLVERQAGMTDIELVIEEISQGKVGIDYDKSDLTPPDYESSPTK